MFTSGRWVPGNAQSIFPRNRREISIFLTTAVGGLVCVCSGQVIVGGATSCPVTVLLVSSLRDSDDDDDNDDDDYDDDVLCARVSETSYDAIKSTYS